MNKPRNRLSTHHDIYPELTNPSPREVWGLWGSSEDDPAHAGWILSSDGGDEDVIVAYLSLKGAKEGAQHHLDLYEIKCSPRRILPATGPTEEALVEIVRLVAVSIEQTERLLHAPALEHQIGKLNQLHTYLCGIVGFLVDADGWDGTNSGEGGKGGAS